MNRRLARLDSTRHPSSLALPRCPGVRTVYYSGEYSIHRIRQANNLEIEIAMVDLTK